MSKETEIPINYTKEAFLQPVNLGALLVLVTGGFLAGGVGLATNLILTLVCAVELLYLGIVPKMSRFRKHTKLKKLNEQNSELGEKDVFKRLGENSKRKYLVLRRLVKMIKNNFDSQPYTSQGLLERIREKVDELLSNYLMLLDLHKRYKIYTSSNIEERLQKQLKEQEQGMDELESDQLRETKQRRVAILQKRLKKFKRVKEKYLICETHLETIDDAIRYIYEQSMTMSDPEQIGMQLDDVLAEMEETSNLIGEFEPVSIHNNNELEVEKLDIELEKAQQQQKNKVRENR